MRACAVVVGCALACAAWPAGARGSEATATELRALAATAQRDPAALERLRAVDTVDGRPVQLGEALRGSGAELRARLRALAQDEATATPPAAGAREQARAVLAQQRFRPSTVRTPLRSLRERVGAALRPLGRPFEAAYRWVEGWLPGGPPVLWALLAAAVLGAAAALAARAGARRAGAGDADARGSGGPARVSAAGLRRDADRAERDGELDAALRLRFRAGLVDLDSHELIELRPALTNRQLLREVPSPTLAGLVDGFEAVAYGGRPAASEDLRDARDGWPRVVEEAGAR